MPRAYRVALRPQSFQPFDCIIQLQRLNRRLTGFRLIWGILRRGRDRFRGARFARSAVGLAGLRMAADFHGEDIQDFLFLVQDNAGSRAGIWNLAIFVVGRNKRGQFMFLCFLDAGKELFSDFECSGFFDHVAFLDRSALALVRVSIGIGPVDLPLKVSSIVGAMPGQ